MAKALKTGRAGAWSHITARVGRIGEPFFGKMWLAELEAAAGGVDYAAVGVAIKRCEPREGLLNEQNNC